MPRRRRNTTSISGTLVILLILFILYFAQNGLPSADELGAPPTPTPVSVANPDASPAAVLLASLQKPAPVVETFKGCPPDGDGGDRELNWLKNRIDVAPFVPVTLDALLELEWPSGTEGRFHSRWSAADRAFIKRYEGAPVSVIGYLIDVKRQGPESTNCHSVEDVDRHIWMTGTPGESRADSLVVETTPRVQTLHPEWTTAAFTRLENLKARVRVSGWLLFDQEHPEQLGITRGTLWEIHPLMQIEVDSGEGFVELGK